MRGMAWRFELARDSLASWVYKNSLASKAAALEPANAVRIPYLALE